MKSGTVKWFDSKKGYGFIVPDDGPKDVFVHITQIEKIGLRRLRDHEHAWREADTVRLRD